jgi:hypothetical protein
MLEIVIESQRIRIGPDAIPYDSYYFVLWDRQGDPGPPVVRRVLAQWADAVERLRSAQSTVYLPFSLDDQSVEAFKARLVDHKVALRCVTLAENGYMINLDDVNDFIQEAHRVLHEYPQDFGAYERADLVAALRNARIDAA